MSSSLSFFKNRVPINRPARVFRFPHGTLETHAIVSEFADDYQFGDLLCFHVTQNIDPDTPLYNVCIYLGSLKLARDNQIVFAQDWTRETHRIENYRLRSGDRISIPLTVTNHFADAFEHYQGVIDEAIERKKENQAAFGITLQVHPADKGFARLFCNNLPHFDDINLIRRWRWLKIDDYPSSVSPYAVTEIDFGTGFELKFELMLPTDKLAHFANYEFPIAPLDIKPAVAAYRQTLGTKMCFFVLFDHRFGYNHLNMMLNDRGVLPDSWIFDGTEIGLCGKFQFTIATFYGPRQTFDRAAIKTKMQAISIAEQMRIGSRLRFTRLVVEGDKPRSRNTLITFENLQLSQSNRYTKTFVLWADIQFQWQSVHRSILDNTIALADRHLPPYVILEILDWLPECYHAIHFNKINLITNIAASIRKVFRERAGNTTRYGRTVIRRIKN